MKKGKKRHREPSPIKSDSGSSDDVSLSSQSEQTDSKIDKRKKEKGNKMTFHEN